MSNDGSNIWFTLSGDFYLVSVTLSTPQFTNPRDETTKQIKTYLKTPFL